MPLILLPFLLQITPIQPMPKGTGMPPAPQDEASGVMRPVNAVFAAIAASDGELLRPVVPRRRQSDGRDRGR